MNQIEQQHDRRHQRRVEDVEPDLAAEQVAVVALDILGDAEDGAHHDEHAGGVEGVEDPAPRDRVGLRMGGRGLVDAVVEEDGDDDEEAEEDELHCEPADYDPLARCPGGLVRLGDESGACTRSALWSVMRKRLGFAHQSTGP